MRDLLNKTETFLAAVNAVKSRRQNGILEGHSGLFGMGSPGGRLEARTSDNRAVLGGVSRRWRVGLPFFRFLLHASSAEFMRRPVHTPERPWPDRLEIAEQRNCGRLSASRLFQNLLDWVEMPSEKSRWESHRGRPGLGQVGPCPSFAPAWEQFSWAHRDDSQGKYWAPFPGLGAPRAKARLMNLCPHRPWAAARQTPTSATKSRDRSCPLPTLRPHGLGLDSTGL